jgi:ElaB/YqjD/DUF883 family membrane-anchored ribosome-binding protein
MFGRSGYAAANLGELERQVRSLERRLETVANRAPAVAARKTDDISEVIASALGGIAERFRNGAASFGDAGDLGREAARLGTEAARLGTDALQRVSKEVERRPLVTLGVAVGVGILVGLMSHRR